jgi:chaperonin GroEL
MQNLSDILYYDDDARKKIVAGVNKLADAVKITMGPGGRFVVLAQDGDLPPIVTKDGVSIAEYFKLIDPVENEGAKLMKQSSRRTVETVGDGTTTAAVLTQAIVKGTVVNNVREFRAGMSLAADAISDYLESKLVVCNDEDTLYKIAYTSSNGDEDIAKMVSSMAYAVGKEGIIEVKSSELDKTVGKVETGFKFDQGVPSSVFLNQEDTGKCVVDDAMLLILKDKLEVFGHIEDMARFANKNGKALIVMAPEFSKAVIDMCEENIKRNLAIVVPILPPEFGDRMATSLDDVSVYCDASVSNIAALKLGDEIKLGQISSFRSNLTTTTITSENSDGRIAVRVQRIKNLIEESENKHDQRKLRQRIAQMSAGFAKISVGGITEAETKERFDRYEDAVGACTAAMKEGVLPGGGIALYRAGCEIECKYTSDIKLGFETVLKACKAPYHQILDNADITGHIDLSRELQLDFNMGIDASQGQPVNMIEAGIIDPIKVTVAALRSAVSVASIILSIGCVMNSHQINVEL